MSRQPKRQLGKYPRYCSACGWGFTWGHWRRDAFCPRCGNELAKGSGHTGRGWGIGQSRKGRTWRSQNGAAPRWRSTGEEGSVRALAPEVMPTTGQLSNRSVKLRVPEKFLPVCQFAVEHPFLSASGGALAGMGMLAGGHAVSALGASIMTIGGVITGLSVAGCMLEAGQQNRRRGRDASAIHGIGLGIGLMVAGAGVSIAGQVISVAGGATIAGSGVLAAYGAGKATGNIPEITCHSIPRLTQPRFREVNSWIGSGKESHRQPQ